MADVHEVDAITGIVIERDFTPEETAQREQDQAHAVAAQVLADAEAEAKSSARTALLERLGITEDEAKLLLGGA
jgi:hypothetical protein